jgi:phosphatidylglycerophosphatase A
MAVQAPSSSPTAILVATLAGIGRLPIAPGTAASLVALPFAWLLLRFGGVTGIAIAIVAVIVVGTWACDVYARISGSTDPPECVVDELAGQWIACAFAPLTLGGFAVAFVLFRIFDIVKPWPVSRAEQFSGGAGIMADDLLAGAIAGLIVAVVSGIGLV